MDTSCSPNELLDAHRVSSSLYSPSSSEVLSSEASSILGMDCKRNTQYNLCQGETLTLLYFIPNKIEINKTTRYCNSNTCCYKIIVAIIENNIQFFL